MWSSIRSRPRTAMLDDDYAMGVARLVVIVLAWSTIGLTTRLMDGATGLEVSAGRSGVMTVVLLVWLALREDKLAMPRDGTGWLSLLLVTCFFAVGSTLTIVAYTMTHVAHVASIAATSPIIAALLAPVVLGERTSLALWFACALAMAGVWLVAGPSRHGPPNLGDLAALGSALVFGCQIVALRRFARVDLVPAYVLGGICTTAFGVLLAGGFSVSPHDALLILFMGTVQLAFPALMLLRAARGVPAVHMALVLLLDIVLSPLWAFLLLGEKVATSAMAGGALIVMAVTLVAVGGARRAPS